MLHARVRMRSAPIRAVWCAVVVLAACLGAAPRTQEPTVPAPQGGSVDAAAIDAQQKLIEGNASLSEELRKQALDILAEARAHLEQQAEWDARRADLQKTIDAAPQLLDELAAAARRPRPEPQLTVTARSPLAEVEAQLESWREERRRRTADLQQVEKNLQQLDTSRQELPKLLAAQVTERDAVQQLLAAPAPEGENPLLVQARRLRQRAHLQRVDAATAQLTLEQKSLDTLTQLAQARRDELRGSVALADAYIERLQQVATDARQDAVNALEETARAQLGRLPEPLRPLGQQNLELVARQREAVRAREELARLRADIEKQAHVLDSELEAARRRVELVGLTEATGLELRQLRRSQLADAQQLGRRARDLGARQTRAFEARFTYEDARDDLADLDTETERQFDLLRIPPEQRPALAPAARAALQVRRTIVTALADVYRVLTNEHWAVDAQLKLLNERAGEAATFVDERVLWIPSTRPVWRFDGASLASIGPRLMESVQAGAAALRTEALEQPVPLAFAGLVVLAFLLLRPWLLRRLKKHGTAARNRTTVSIVPTLLGLLDSVLLALPLPLTMLVAGASIPPGSDAAPIEAALFATAPMIFTLALVRELVRPDGLGDAHFGWSATLRSELRRSLRWLTPLLVVSQLAYATLIAQNVEQGQGEVSRALLLPSLIGLAVFLARLLHPSRGALFRGSTAETPGRRIRVLLYLLGLGVPAALAGLALFGYAFTAVELYTRLLQTLSLAFLALLGHSLAVRWLLLSRRSLSIQQARERRRLLAEQDPDALAEQEQKAIDLVAVDQQTRKLVRQAVALALVIVSWAIWVDVLPALGLLREVELWDETVTVTLVEQTADGTEQARTVDRIQPITLSNLLLALIVVLATVVLSRNIGGLLEIVLLRHLAMQAGERYATTTLIRYVVVAVGTLVAFGAVGLGWSKVQWLIAAVSVGLGFGLQEIFANFVSGVILLFERPMRVGDLVTVGDVDGRVTRIQMRATTIVDFDRKELIVPNRDFITSPFVNWSLSSAVTRIVVKVGVAYGTDTARALELLDECARGCRTVLRDPEPSAVFRGFGDSTLDLELRVFIESMDDWTAAMNEVHRAVDETFKAHGIEIAFPQRDLHVRSAKGLQGVFASIEPVPDAARPDAGAPRADAPRAGAPPAGAPQPSA